MKRDSLRTLRRWGPPLLLLAAGALFAGADTARSLIEQGNQHYAAGRFAEALACYEQAASDVARPAPELLHNLAAARFKLGQIEEARDAWVRVKEAGDAAFEAQTRYNLGNCDYAEALAATAENPQQALEHLAAAAEQYRAAVQLDSQLADARANLELTQRLRQLIEEQMESQPQTQPSECQQEGDQQQPSTQPSQGQPEQDEPSAESQPSQQQPQEGQEQDQEDAQAESQPQAEAPPPNEAAETQPNQEQQPEGAEPRPVQLTREQAERLLQMIRDAEKARRERLARQRAASQKPVERDW